MKKYLVVLISLVLLVSLFVYLNTPHEDDFKAIRNDAPTVKFTVSEGNTLTAVLSNLEYYGFVKDQDTLRYALEHTNDNTPDSENAINVRNNTIQKEASFNISQSMNIWQIADILLNGGTPCGRMCPALFEPEILPGGNIAPSLQEQMQEKYRWITTYEDCVEAKGSDGGQLSSEQYYERTGIRRCVSPDGREFTEGQEGWSDHPSP